LNKADNNAQARSDGPERRCVLSGERADPASMIRLACGPDGQIAPDVRAKAPGRGAWLGVGRSALETAMAKGKLKGALARAFKTGALDIPANLPDLIEAGLTQAMLDRMGLEARSGALLTGSDKINEAARRGKVVALYHASDASADGSGKLDQAWRVGTESEGSKLTGRVLPVDRTRLSVALGRQNVVHLALTDDRAAARINHHLDRLTQFREGEAMAQTV
jgi:predicted RNA-binding protein YlxR (DUF448 family)